MPERILNSVERAIRRGRECISEFERLTDPARGVTGDVERPKLVDPSGYYVPTARET